ncbi:hypothetical protein RD792_001227 [Penstemon davidsonii]|uniref:Multidrug resistance protein NorM n=1 Tax=Penstemon davidsonii TaxID=160366 RepID=A0ABR0DMV0_9LAMI|nr:hypothetical protein RD792_001227 [Penstemon davidsonii]
MESAEEPLMLLQEEEINKRDLFVREVKKVSYIAVPMVAVWVSQYMLRAVSMMMLGHLDELALSSSAIATSLVNVTGFSLIAYGAGHYQKVGIYTYGSVIWLFVACVPVCLLWIYTDNMLILIGQDPLISVEAGKFAIWLIPSLFPYAILQSLVRYLQTQSLIMPMLWGSLASLCFHLPLCWAFVFKLNLGNAGAALSISISYWLNVIILGIYVKYSSTCSKTRASFSKDVFLTMGEFFRFAIPSAVMVCTRVSNELGAGKPKAAQLVVSVVMALSIVEFVIASIVLFFCRSILGYSFSNEKGVVNYVKDMTPFLCASVIMDSLQAVLSGVARGSGWQHIGAYVNLGAYYLVGIPVSFILGFVLGLKGEGLWSGLIAGATVQSILLIIITCRTNWEKKAAEARWRIFDGNVPLHDELI